MKAQGNLGVNTELRQLSRAILIPPILVAHVTVSIRGRKMPAGPLDVYSFNVPNILLSSLHRVLHAPCCVFCPEFLPMLGYASVS